MGQLRLSANSFGTAADPAPSAPPLHPLHRSSRSSRSIRCLCAVCPLCSDGLFRAADPFLNLAGVLFRIP